MEKVKNCIIWSLIFIFTSLMSCQTRQNNNAILPQGTGFASQFKADVDISKHSAVIFSDDFESGELGATWDEIRTKDALSLISPDDVICGKRCLKVEARLSENTGGSLTKWFKSSESVFVRFYVRFDPDCDYIHHFVALRGNKGLEGNDKYSGFGKAGTCPKGDDYFYTSIDPMGKGHWPAPGKWVLYTYWPQMEGSPNGKYWGNLFQPEQQELIEKDRWICVEFMLKHNTPCRADGEQAFWIDGVLMGHWGGFNWRTVESLQANSLMLDSYITNSVTGQEINTVYFDNVVIAREYIGPASR